MPLFELGVQSSINNNLKDEPSYNLCITYRFMKQMRHNVHSDWLN